MNGTWQPAEASNQENNVTPHYGLIQEIFICKKTTMHYNFNISYFNNNTHFSPKSHLTSITQVYKIDNSGKILP
jgi:hypothetical protein